MSAFADQELAAWAALAASFGSDRDGGAMRAAGEQRARARALRPRMHTVGDVSFEWLRARVYRPAGSRLALILYLHGGGWTIGSIEAHDRVARRLAAGSGCAMTSLNYRLAPEDSRPASVDDTVTALCWIANGGEGRLGPLTGAVAVAGDSAGGALATLGCIRLRDGHDDALPSLRVLVYANTDLTGFQPSMTEKASGWGLEADTVRHRRA